MGTVVPPLYRIVTKSWLSGQSISSVSSSNNNPLDTRLWGWTKKKDCGLLPGNQTENTHEFMQLFFHTNAKISYIYLQTKRNRVIVHGQKVREALYMILKNRKNSNSSRKRNRTFFSKTMPPKISLRFTTWLAWFMETTFN